MAEAYSWKNSFEGKDHLIYENVSKHLKLWIYSWMRPGCCETEDEYKVSKLMFLKFLNSEQIRLTLGSLFIDKVEDFLKKNVESYEKNFLFYLRKHHRHFDEYVNSLHEGTNNAIRSSAAACTPNMNIENTLVVLNENANRSYHEKCLERSKQIHGTKLYADLKCAEHLVHMGYSILNNSWLRRRKYCSIRVTSTQWLVKYDSHNFPQKNQDDKKRTG